MGKPLAMVVGAGPGLGIALVRRFAQGGMSVAFVARRPDAVAAYQKQLDAEGLDTRGVVADAGDPATISRVVAKLRETHGEAEAAIYNAAIIEPSRLVTPSGIGEARYATAPGWKAHGEPVDFDYLMDSFRTNVAGAHHLAREVAPGMIERGRGTILLTGGVLAFGPWIEWGVTSLGKAALRSLGHSLYKELSPHGVQVSTVAIHGTMAKDTPYDHDRVADAYWQVHARPRDQWGPDFHFKPHEDDGADPDV
ncbi:SDR family NAD(P)-dependent oxidoreductase [Aquamicrobium sp. LC103]|uniref:SDR family NAD(P)-dependent oxidoreductase n=1 Tax=Aquamicrobium sp. LC103 TaxID=1120658 RepID=UPI00063E732C|nr:SDR family NAD(P)-dependent oxidoreductase [Aquamicrobium sp. LC103]TKT75721.1 SDR family NAD(P)-dependent oxidoreductase [Aquamicrobium sp. LC103]